MTKLTSRLRAWSDRVLLTPVLRGLAKPFQLLWAAIALIARQIWRWLLRPVWRWLLRPVWQWVLRPVLWLPLRWIGLQTWRWLLRPIWRWVLRPLLWLPLRWIGLQIWRWLLRPAWALLRLAWAALLASPLLLTRALPNRGWLTGLIVLALTAAVLFAPGKVNAKTHDRLSPVTNGSTSQSLGALRPEITVNLAPFEGWGLTPSDDQHRELILKHNEAELRVLRKDGVPNAEEYLRQYARSQLGVGDQGNYYPERTSVKDAHGKSVQVLLIEQTYHTRNPRNHDLDRFHQAVLYNYGTTVLLLLLSTNWSQAKPLVDEMLALKASVRITP